MAVIITYEYSTEQGSDSFWPIWEQSLCHLGGHFQGKAVLLASTGHTRVGVQRAWKMLVGHGNGHHFVGLTEGHSTVKRWSDSPRDYMLDHEWPGWTRERSRGNSKFSKTFSTQEGLPFKEEDITHTQSQPAKVPGSCVYSLRQARLYNAGPWASPSWTERQFQSSFVKQRRLPILSAYSRTNCSSGKKVLTWGQRVASLSLHMKMQTNGPSLLWFLGVWNAIQLVTCRPQSRFSINGSCYCLNKRSFPISGAPRHSGRWKGTQVDPTHKSPRFRR